MTIIIRENEKSRIRYKSADGICSVEVDGKEIDGLIVGMSTNGTYTIQTLDDICEVEKEKPRVMGADDNTNDSLS